MEDEMNLTPEGTLTTGEAAEPAEEAIEPQEAEVASEPLEAEDKAIAEATTETEETGIKAVKDPKGTRALAHISLWLGVLGVLAAASQFLLLLLPFATIQQWHLSVVYVSFGTGGLASAFAAVCLLRLRKRTHTVRARRSRGMGITGLIFGLLPFATYLTLSALFN